jgi:hypothetical protein
MPDLLEMKPGQLNTGLVNTDLKNFSSRAQLRILRRFRYGGEGKQPKALAPSAPYRCEEERVI